MKSESRLAKKARNLSAAKLKQVSRSTAGHAAELRHKNRKEAPIWDRMAGIYAAKEARRAPPDEPTTHELFALLDEQTRAELRMTRCGPVPRAARIEPATTTPAPEPPAAAEGGTLTSLLAGIRRYHEQQAQQSMS